MQSWSRRLGGESVFVDSTGVLLETSQIRPAGGNLRHKAFKFRVRARMAGNTVTHRKGGPWSNVLILYPGNPSSATQGFCEVGDKLYASAFCDANIAGVLGQVEVDGALGIEVHLVGGGLSPLTAAHAAGHSVSSGGFRVEARTSPDVWEVVSLDREWRDYC